MSELLKPPTVPSAILNYFFSNQPDFAAVIGDMSEEFHQRVQSKSSSLQAAKFWYWREAFRNAMALTAREAFRTPIRTLIVALGCLVAVNAVTFLYCYAYWYHNPSRRLDDLALDQNQREIILLLQFAASLALGWTGGRLLPSREWALALMYAVVSPLIVPVGFGLVRNLALHPTLHLPAELDFLYFQPVRVFLIWELTLRLGGFLLGCLWITRSRSMIRFALVLAAVVPLEMMTAPPTHAQSIPTPKTAFEVASIKRCKEGDDSAGRGGGKRSSPGRLSQQCETMANFIREAFLVYTDGKERLFISKRLMDQPISGSPAWINTDLYDIEAKSEDAVGEGMLKGPLLQALLEDRLKLRVHRETREVPIYVLTVAKGGPTLKVAREDSCIPLGSAPPPRAGQPLPSICGGFRASANSVVTYHQTMTSLCWNFSNLFDRDVIDKTGLAGMFDIEFEIDRQSLLAEVPQGGTNPDPAVITDAFRAALPKLGLKLEASKGSSEFLVIDHVERPSEN